MEYADADLIAILTAQRNAALTDSAKLQAIIMKLQKDLAARDAEITALKSKKKR